MWPKPSAQTTVWSSTSATDRAGIRLAAHFFCHPILEAANRGRILFGDLFAGRRKWAKIVQRDKDGRNAEQRGRTHRRFSSGHVAVLRIEIAFNRSRFRCNAPENRRHWAAWIPRSFKIEHYTAERIPNANPFARHRGTFTTRFAMPWCVAAAVMARRVPWESWRLIQRNPSSTLIGGERRRRSLVLHHR